ncbi:hypothetical protein e1012e08.tmp0331 [Eimeria tenella]|uniref:Uncharacterized protein n=1 Tax=Eimeria tenella TaxID=5802 RepID=C8TDN0_EIMTE|nr:hypothetical protein e1012e08.tmp0331 [Eimeria tenella]
MAQCGVLLENKSSDRFFDKLCMLQEFSEYVHCVTEIVLLTENQNILGMLIQSIKVNAQAIINPDSFCEIASTLIIAVFKTADEKPQKSSQAHSRAVQEIFD